MNQEELPLTDQTRFTFEKPLFEDAAVVSAAEPAAEMKRPWFKTKKGLAILLSCVVFCILLLVATVFLTRQSDTVVPDQIQVQTLPSPSLTPNQQKISDLREELEEADPAKQEFPFPPVSMEIVLPDLTKPNN